MGHKKRIELGQKVEGFDFKIELKEKRKVGKKDR